MNVGVAEAKDRLSELIERAENGESVTITRHGKARVTLQPVEHRPSLAEIDAVLAAIAADRAKLPPMTTEEVIAAVKADRRW